MRRRIGEQPMSESISDFMERRRREVARLGGAAMAAAHGAYAKAIRAGRDLRLEAPGDVMRHGASLVGAPVMAGADASNDGQIENWLDRSPSAKAAAGEAARRMGDAVGVARGGMHAVEGLVDAGTFIGRLANPYDRLVSPPGRSAADQLMNFGQGVVDYVKDGIADPQRVIGDVRRKAHQMRVELDPGATPVAPTFVGELHRNFDIGQNQGELAFNVGSLAVGGPLAKGIEEFGAVSRIANAEKYLAQGASPELAAYLAEPYKGMGHHFGPRRLGLPEDFSESVFNVLKPREISRGDMYELHYKVDPHFNQARLPARVGGGSWRGEALGLEKYDLLGRILHGSPAPFKARVGGLSAGVGSAVRDGDRDYETW
jgi:hypothetical protein